MGHKQFKTAAQGPTALEFFAGIGLARAGLAQSGAEVIWASDYDLDKQKMYENHWGFGDYLLANVHEVSGEDVPSADIAWASSPCTDLSLAGARVGLRGGRESSAFFGFTRVIDEMGIRKPSLLVLENVPGLASSHNGADLKAATMAFNDLGYAVDVVILDARRWVPQSRPRLFMVGASGHVIHGENDSTIRPNSVSWVHDDTALRTFRMPTPLPPEPIGGGFISVVEDLDVSDERWWEESRVASFIASMSDSQRNRLQMLQQSPTDVARTAYRRTRKGVPTWEMRSDDIAGCLRTARGGSSKQAVVILGNGEVRIRWMTSLEYARLMGAGDFRLDGLRPAQIHYGFGDAVAVPAVTWLTEHMLLPLLHVDRFEKELLAGD